jgi:pilus assembly protein Flp/PilA
MLQLYQTVTAWIRSLDRQEDGASAAEYGLLVAGIALLIVVGVFAFGEALSTFFDALAATVGEWGS